MVRAILVPVDGSDHAQKAIAFAADTAKEHDATVHLLHVVKQIKITEGLKTYIRTEKVEKPPEKLYLELVGKRILEEAKDEAEGHGIKHVETSVTVGDPYKGGRP